MTSSDDFSIRRHLGLLQKALKLARSGNGKTTDEIMLAALGYFIIQAARGGVRDPAELARIAVAGVAEEPDIIDALAAEISGIEE